MKEFGYELSLAEVRVCRDALSSCSTKHFDVELCKKLTEVLNKPALHNSRAKPRLMSWILKSFK